MGEAIAEALPTIRTQVRGQRAFLGRAVRYLARDAGMRQFLDVGTGIPSAGNVHDVAQEIAPESRVLYVDNDPIVMVHARALMAGTAEGTVAFILYDLARARGHFLGDLVVAKTPTWPSPSAWCSSGSCTISRDGDDSGGGRRHPGRRPGPRQLPGAVPDDPRLRPRGDARPGGVGTGRIPNVPRTLVETEPFFAGLSLVDPGLVPLAAWRPDPGAELGPHRRLRLRGRPQALDWRDATSAAVATCGDRPDRGAAVGVDARAAPVGGGAGTGRGAGRRLGPVPLDAMYASPLERCQETAAVVAEAKGLKVETLEDMGEVRYGDWTGRPLKELAKEPLWKVVQATPSAARFPEGESIYEMSRAVLAVERLREAHRPRPWPCAATPT